jgi:YidC/Oxa1 family membrane protein insertase
VIPVPLLANIIGDVFSAFLNLLGFVLAFFYRFIPSIGVSIILLTVVLRLLVWPLTAKQARSMLSMQRAQPEIKRLQAKYKDDRQKLNEEMMKFYKENEINPFGGCLPLVLQMPIFIGLYQLLNKIPSHIPTSGPFASMYDAICNAPGAACFADPSSYKLPFFPNGIFDLALSAGKGHDSFVGALPYWILVALVVVSAYAQQKQTMRFQTQVNAQMQMVGRIMPLFFAFISINIPAGVVLYFFVSNLWQIGQQEVVYRKIGTPTGEPVGKKAKARHIEAKSRETTDAPSIDAGPGAGSGNDQSAGNGSAAAKGSADPNRSRKKRKRK